MERMHEKGKYVFFVVLIIGILFLIFLFNSFFLTLDEKSVEVSFEVSNISGIDLNESSLEFGKIIPGSSSTRNLIIGNNYPYPIFVKISSFGNISDFISFEDEVYIGEGYSYPIAVSVQIPKGQEYGKYTGYIKVLIKRKIFS